LGNNYRDWKGLGKNWEEFKGTFSRDFQSYVSFHHPNPPALTTKIVG
jgi:hypothetical protein